MSASFITSKQTPLPVRPLTRAEVRGLREANLYPVNQENLDRTIDAVMEAVLSPAERAEIEALPWKEGARFFHEVMKETFGAADEEKNSPPSGTGTPIPDGSPTAASA